MVGFARETSGEISYVVRSNSTRSEGEFVERPPTYSSGQFFLSAFSNAQFFLAHLQIGLHSSIRLP